MTLRALVPTISAASAAVAIRMAERWARFEQYSLFWQVRPRVRGTQAHNRWASAGDQPYNFSKWKRHSEGSQALFNIWISEGEVSSSFHTVLQRQA